MDGEFPLAQKLADLPDLPRELAEFCYVDLKNRVIHVEPRRKGTTLLLTWIDRCRTKGIRFETKYSELPDIQMYRETNMELAPATVPAPGDFTLENRDAAIALLKLGAEYRASDIHVRLMGTHTEIELRVKGELRTARRVSQAEGEAITRAFYTSIAVAKDSSYMPREVQSAQISGPVLAGTGMSSVRIVRGPAYPEEDGGGFMVLRLQYVEAKTGPAIIKRTLPPLQMPRAPDGVLKLESLGYTRPQSDRLKYIMEGPSGMTIFTGPTGSGKTTSIAELLKELARRSRGKRIIAIEDPIEYPMLFAIQLVITNSIEGKITRDQFAEFLRHALRMDPDTIFLGELRSVEAFLAAFQAALTGHRVPSTVHVTDPYNVAERIEIMDPTRLPRKMFCNSKIIRGIINQRLVPHLCPKCSVQFAPRHEPEIEARLMGALRTYGNLAEVRFRGEGCEACDFSSIRDRVAVAEVIATDRELMTDLVEHGSDVARKNFRARQDADRSVLFTAMQRVLAGHIDPRDVGENVDVVVPFEQVDL